MGKWRYGIEALTVEPVAVGDAIGYRVSYRRSTLDGAPESGLAYMLHGSDNRLHVVNARIGEVDVDLLRLENDDYGLREVLDSFRLLPELDASTD